MTHLTARTYHPKFACLALTGLVSAMLVLTPVAAKALDLDSYLDTVRKDNGLPALAAAVIEDGKVVAAAAVGTRVLGKDFPVTIDDRFHIGSNTKSMTATLAGMMVEEGKLRWDSRIGEVLGDDVKGMSASLANATLEQLLSHSSGIPTDDEEMIDLYFNTDAFEYNLSDLRLHLLDQWKENEISVPDGSPFQYSNLGYIIAGMMIEKVTGTPWEQLMRERIFTPLEMQTAGFGAQATYGLIDAPVGHRIEPDGSATPMLWGPAADMPPVLAPAGNVHMSIIDYAKWADWNAGKGARGPALVSAETLHHIQSAKVHTPVRDNPPPGTPSTGDYGLGWGFVTFDWADGPIMTHNGSNSLNLAKIAIDPERDLAIVVTTNFAGGKADMAAGEVMQHLYETYTK
ncbi:serine hydrolase domain-containing protein [Hoeflea sp. Naph1]|uniref:serine hydrolase domain-containing protein n=1 Tax=Hoeflea sp. Naph1 TaxID=3388653 RepID=UPI00398FF78B